MSDRLVRRRPIFAATLSLIAIGLGDAYNGFPGKGAALFIFAFGLGLAGIAAVVVFSSGPSPSPIPLGILLAAVAVCSLLLQVYAVTRAWRDARRLGDSPSPPRRVLICLMYFVGAVTLGGIASRAIRTSGIKAYRIPIQSMAPAIEAGDRIFVNRFAYASRIDIAPLGVTFLRQAHVPTPGDVVVFISPKDRSQEFVRRVVAIGGQTVELRHAQLYVDGHPWHAPSDNDALGMSVVARDGLPACGAIWGEQSGLDCGPSTVAPGTVFVLGDDTLERRFAARYWGAVPLADIEGKAILIYWSWDSKSGKARWDRVGRTIG